MHVHIHARTHTYMNIRIVLFSGCGKRPITQIVADPTGIELTKFRQGQHHQLPIVQHVWFTVPKAGTTRLKWTCSTSVYAHSVLWHRETLKQTNTLHLRWRIWLLHADFKPDMFSFSFWLWELPEIDPPVIVHHRPANRNAVVTGTRCIVVNQLPRWNWHRCKQSVDCIDLCPFVTVHTHAKACRHIWRQACMPEHTHTGTQTDGHAHAKLFWLRLPIHISLYEWLEAALIEINWVLSRHVYSHLCIVHWFLVWFG